jgi:RsiW-degrading membrane proteinase PrsW (M82 family)
MQPHVHRQQDILLIIFSSLAILGLFIRCIYLVVTGIISFDPGYMESLASNLLGALGMLFCAILLLPMLILSIQALKGQSVRPATIRSIKLLPLVGLVLVWVVCLVLGSVLYGMFNYGWALAAIFFLPGIGLPIMVLVWIATGGLPSGSVRRLWSVFGISMVGSTLAALLMEYLVVGVVVLVVGIAVATNPGLLNVVTNLKNQVTSANAGDIESLLIVLAPYIANPLVILSILFFAAVLTPMIEEALKPAVLWVLGKRLHSPTEGFVLGALCGAGFATMEGLLAASGASQMWAIGQAGRAAASLMHITASGILGWGIASAQLEKHYGRLALAYFLAVSIHGLWNGSAILAVFGSLRAIAQKTSVDLVGGIFVVAGLVFLSLVLVLMCTALPMINHRLRLSLESDIPRGPSPFMEGSSLASSQKQSDIIAPPSSE